MKNKKIERTEKIETRGRPKKASGDKQGSRAICRLDAADKATLEAHAKKSRLSESAILRAGLVEIGVLTHAKGEN